jgi:NAD(P)-dependent dehydrogenase (short-subunit alcohol dehydrogenase family)
MANDGMVQEKVVVVTGAGRGIGRGFALLMAEHGAKVVVNDIGAAVDGEGSDDTPADEVVNLIRDAGGEAVVCRESVSDPKGGERIIEAALDSFGQIDAVVNNAGILRDTIFHKMSAEEWNAVIGVHLNGSFYVSRAAAPHFRKQSSGCFVHMTSTSGLVGNVGQANYSAAKMGIVGLSKSIALDMARFRVRSNCISPFAWSRMIGSIPTNTPEQETRVNKLKQMTPEKIAPMAVYLCSHAADEANVSGQIFGVRNNEIFLFSQNRPLRSVQRSDGWTPELIAEHAVPTFDAHFYDLSVSAEVFSWDPA